MPQGDEEGAPAREEGRYGLVLDVHETLQQQPHLWTCASKLRPELYYAAAHGNVDALDAAIARGASLTWADLGKGRTALWVASYYGEDE